MQSQHLLAASHGAGVSILSYDTSAAAAEIPRALPSQFALSVYPNPFNSTAQLRLAVPAPGAYELAIYDLLGNRIRQETLRLSGESRRNISFSNCAAGVYFARLSNPKFSATTKLLYLP
jgi:hypothetical protein